MKFKAKERMALIGKKNMKDMVEYFSGTEGKDFDLSEGVNYLVEIALGELKAIDEIIEKEEMMSNCNGCECMKMYDDRKRIYYCNHKDRIDDMGKIGTDRLPETSPEWCPLKK